MDYDNNPIHNFFGYGLEYINPVLVEPDQIPPHFCVEIHWLNL